VRSEKGEVRSEKGEVRSEKGEFQTILSFKRKNQNSIIAY